MDLNEKQALVAGYDRCWIRATDRPILGPTGSVIAYDAQQFDDYFMYVSSISTPGSMPSGGGRSSPRTFGA
jgi:hypothetical protein